MDIIEFKYIVKRFVQIREIEEEEIKIKKKKVEEERRKEEERVELTLTPMLGITTHSILNR